MSRPNESVPQRRRARRRRLVALMSAAMLITSCGSAPAPAEATDVGKTTINKWKDGKRAVYLLSFDDNLTSQLENVIPELNRRQIVGTFYVITGSPLWQADEQQWAEAAKSPFVSLANHTFTHAGVDSVAELDVELQESNAVLYGVYADKQQPFLLSFGMPGGVPWNVTDAEQQAALARHNLVDRPPFRGSPMNYTTQDELVASVDQALAQGELGYDDMHGVGGDYLTTPIDWFTALLDKLDQEKDRVWVPDAVSYAKYLAERQTADVKVTRASANEIVLSLTSKVDPALYNYPLTLTTKVPFGWIRATVMQGDVSKEVAVQEGSLMFDAVPGQQDIRIIPK